jgi:hypothetical protein
MRCKVTLEILLILVFLLLINFNNEFKLKGNECKRGFAGGESYYAGTDLLEYCMSCYFKKHSKVCSKCPNMITPGNSYILFQEKNYHFDVNIMQKTHIKLSSMNYHLFLLVLSLRRL